MGNRTLTPEVADVMVWHGMNLLKKEAPEVIPGLSTQALDLASSTSCVLGQGFGGYGIGKSQLGLSLQECENYGFDMCKNYSPTSHNYSVLTEAWIRSLLDDRRQNSNWCDLCEEVH